MSFSALWARIRAFVAPFHDPRAWALILICAGGVWLFDPVLAKTVAEVALIVGLFVGMGVIISRHVLPQINLTDAVRMAMDNNPIGAGLVVLSCCLTFSTIIFVIENWAAR